MPRPKIALFVGSDVAAHLIMNNVVSEMERMGFEAVLFLPKHPVSSRAQLPELKEGGFYERTLLNDTVYPFIHMPENFHNGAKNLSPQQLSERFDIQYEPVENVNDPAFIQRITDDKEIIGGISIRCFQIFKKPIIDAFYQKDLRKIFLNLHPGLLPEYRGVMSTARRMFDIAAGNTNGSLDYGCTIHRIDENIDTGHILDIASQTLDTSQSAFMANIGLVKPATRLILQALQKIKDGEDTLYGWAQPKSADYFTYPTPEEIKAWKDQGISLIEPEEQIISLLVSKFSKAGSPQGQELEKVIRGSIHTWEAKKKSNGSGKPSISNDMSPPVRNSGNGRDDGPVSAVA